MKIKITAPLLDISGYGNASRIIAKTLDIAGHDLEMNPIRYHTAKDSSVDLDFIQNYKENNEKSKIHLIILPVIEWKNRLEKDKYNIGYQFWETDSLRNDYLEELNSVDEIWSFCPQNTKVYKKYTLNSKKPITEVPLAFSFEKPDGEKFIKRKKEDFWFYSIGQFVRRKDYPTLIKAFGKAFEDNPNVKLFLKTYGISFTAESERKIINQIKMLKPAKNPQIYVSTQKLQEKTLKRMHSTFDCYVSASHSEGWGIPEAEALFNHVPAIIQSYSGFGEVIPKYSLKLKQGLCSVDEREEIGVYHSSHLWGQTDISDLIEKMVYVYTNYEKVQEETYELVAKIRKYYSHKVVARIINKRIFSL